MNKTVKITLWGRDFDLSVIFQNFPGEEVTDNQREVLNSINSIDYTQALEELKKYIKKNNEDELGGDELTNIFRCVIPKSILIPREKDLRVFGIMCNYKFDMEHGLAIVFEDEKYKAVGPQDLIL